ncbi:MAG: hypothetical protein DRN99_02120 [Thermoproteota archaeon]|nr:MAG: hypothetical protein DRN99_02120 [Candidatus Korarchaeota archaeon]
MGLLVAELLDIRGKLGFGSEISVLGYVIDPESMEVKDSFGWEVSEDVKRAILGILERYSRAEDIGVSGRLVNFRGLLGGSACYGVFYKEVIQPIVRVFGSSPRKLVEAGRRLGCRELSYGDASIELKPLPRVPLVYSVWRGDEELPPSANVLFDSTVTHYLPIEDIEALCEISTWRLCRLASTL